MALSALDYRPQRLGEREEESISPWIGQQLQAAPMLPDPAESCPGFEKHVKMVHGTTTLAFKYKGGVVVAVDSRARRRHVSIESPVSCAAMMIARSWSGCHLCGTTGRSGDRVVVAVLGRPGRGPVQSPWLRGPRRRGRVGGEG